MNLNLPGCFAAEVKCWTLPPPPPPPPCSALLRGNGCSCFFVAVGNREPPFTRCLSHPPSRLSACFVVVHTFPSSSPPSLCLFMPLFLSHHTSADEEHSPPITTEHLNVFFHFQPLVYAFAYAELQFRGHRRDGVSVRLQIIRLVELPPQSEASSRLFAPIKTRHGFPSLHLILNSIDRQILCRSS